MTRAVPACISGLQHRFALPAGFVIQATLTSRVGLDAVRRHQVKE
jgi:hypothetical protein